MSDPLKRQSSPRLARGLSACYTDAMSGRNTFLISLAIWVTLAALGTQHVLMLLVGLFVLFVALPFWIGQSLAAKHRKGRRVSRRHV